MEAARQIAHLVLPPFIPKGARLLRRQLKSQDELFDGDDALFKELAATATVYGEYGLGQSTRWVFRHTSAKILGVDTASEWRTRVEGELGGSDRLDLRWTDLGPVKAWGRPLSYERRDHIPDYVNSLWRREDRPDMVLVDGRFRVACFLTSLLEGAPGTPILVDDYVGRPHYHVVEEVVRPDRFCGRQVLFVIPADFDRPLAQDLRDRFLYVME